MILKNEMKFRFLIFFCFFALTAAVEDYSFSYRSYNDILQQIQELNASYPFNIRIYNDESEKIELPDVSDCGNEKYSKILDNLA